MRAHKTSTALDRRLGMSQNLGKELILVTELWFVSDQCYDWLRLFNSYPLYVSNECLKCNTYLLPHMFLCRCLENCAERVNPTDRLALEALIDTSFPILPFYRWVIIILPIWNSVLLSSRVLNNIASFSSVSIVSVRFDHFPECVTGNPSSCTFQMLCWRGCQMSFDFVMELCLNLPLLCETVYSAWLYLTALWDSVRERYSECITILWDSVHELSEFIITLFGIVYGLCLNCYISVRRVY